MSPAAVPAPGLYSALQPLHRPSSLHLSLVCASLAATSSMCQANYHQLLEDQESLNVSASDCRRRCRATFPSFVICHSVLAEHTGAYAEARWQRTRESDILS